MKAIILKPVWLYMNNYSRDEIMIPALPECASAIFQTSSINKMDRAILIRKCY